MRGGGVDELDDDLAQLNNLDVTWGSDLGALLLKHTQQAPAVGIAGDETAETTGSSPGERWTPSRCQHGGSIGLVIEESRT